jgi:hypothetical protein
MAGRREGHRIEPGIHKTGPEPALRQQVNCLESGFPLGPPLPAPSDETPGSWQSVVVLTIRRGG